MRQRLRTYWKPALTTLAWALLLGFAGYRLWPQMAAVLGVGEAGSRAPDFRLETLAGDTVSLSSLAGQVVLVNFWATWCPPCRLEMPGFEDVYRSRRERGFTVVGLSTDVGVRSEVRRFVEERGITYPVAFATGEVVRSYGGVRALPTSFLVDRRGRIRYVVRGFFAEPALARAVDRLLAEDGGV